MKILPLEVSLNSMIDLVEADIREKQDYRDSDIKKRTESDGRKSLFFRKKFKDIKEVDANYRFESYKEYDQFIMNIPNDYLGIVKSVRVNMPGKIIKSNVGNISDKSVVWYRKHPSDDKLVIISKPSLLSLPEGKVIPLIIILFFVIGAIISLAVLTRLKRRKIIYEEINSCPECGTKNNPDDNFCPNCGLKLE